MRLAARGGFAVIAACLTAWQSAAGIDPKQASSETELARLLDVFSGLTAPSTLDDRPAWLETSVDRYGTFVARARELDVGADWFGRGLEVGGRLAADVDDARIALEERTGDREAELEALYSSDAWQRLDYAQVMSDYWRAWTGLSLALKSPAHSRSDATSTPGAPAKAANSVMRCSNLNPAS